MKKSILTSARLILPLLGIATITSAQKLPNTQLNGMRAPVDLKVDGQATEWNNTFQAFNTATDIAYSLANDDDKLYLIIQAKYHDVVDKIIRGGITFTINHTVKKRDEKKISITYPVLRDADMAIVSNMFAKKLNEYEDAKNTAIKVDDINELLQTKDKIINLTGIESITEPGISIYNTEGIKAASKFDGNLAYTCEIVIPLKYLTLPNNGAHAFSYQIKVNEPAAAKLTRSSAPPPPVMMNTLSTTDFWGEYTLVKK